MAEDKKFLTTTEAARILSVSPDTVLKWVKAGKLRSHRTLGGHCRIPTVSLEEFSGDLSLSDMPVLPPPHSPDFQYCWEFLAAGKPVSQECRDCITFRSRSRRCYELRDLPDGLGCLRLGCASSCEDCGYFKIVKEQGVNVLILSDDEGILENPEVLEKSAHMRLRFTSGEYECALIVENFRPDYVVIDCALGKRRTGQVCRNLFDDPRIPVTRIILASGTKRVRDYCDRDIFGWIKRPFSVEQLRGLIGATG